MSHNVDFSEPIPIMIERLKSEHRQLGPKLDEIDSIAKSDPLVALKMMQDIGPKILQHAVEEEARIMRVIMQKAKEESSDSIHIMQEHRWVSEFLERRIKSLANDSKERARMELIRFGNDLRHHFAEEEEIVFPLALRAYHTE